MHANHRELAADRIEHAIAAREPPRMRKCGAAARLGHAAFQHHDRLGPGARRRKCAHEGIGIGQSFGIHGDDPRAVVVDQRLHEVGEAEDRLVAAAHGGPEAEAEAFGTRMRHHGDATTLAHHRHHAGNERRLVSEHRGERGREAVRRVEDAHAVRAAQEEAVRLAIRCERALFLDALAAVLGKAAGPHHACGHACVHAVAHHLEHAVGRHRDDREVGHAGQLAQAGIAGQAGNGGASGIDWPQRTRETEAREIARRGAAEVAFAIGRPDDGHRARREERREAAE